MVVKKMMTRGLMLLMATMSILLSFPSCSMDMRGKGEVHILSVACDYDNESLSPLHGTIDDAVEMGECLREIYEGKGFSVDLRYMLQEGTTISEEDEDYPAAGNVLKAIRGLDVGMEDLFVFFYSGHGDAGVDDDGNYDGTGYLAAAKQGEQMYTELDMDTLFRTVDALSCPAVIIIDACYSGNTADNESPSTGFDNIMDGLDLSNTAVLTASQPTELSYVSSTQTEEGETERHSLFTIGVLQALGWRHSSLRGGYIYIGGRAREYGGYLAYQPSRMDTQQLEDRIMAAWNNQQQTPYFNSTGMKVNIIP